MVHFLFGLDTKGSLDLLDYQTVIHDHIDNIDLHTFAALYQYQPFVMDIKKQKVWRQLSKLFLQYKDGSKIHELFFIDVLINQPNLSQEDFENIQ